MRGYLTTYVNFCWGLGQEIGIGLIMSMLGRNDQVLTKDARPLLVSRAGALGLLTRP